MSDIIVQRLFYGPNVQQGLYYDFPVKVRHFYIPVLVFIFFRILGYSTTINFIFALIAFAYVFYTHHTFRVKKREFLENLMYNDEIEPYNIQSYLNMDDELVDFFYDNKDYVDYNLNAYREALENCNNLLKMEFQIFQHAVYPTQLLTVARQQKEKALNNLHSIIHQLPSTEVSNDTFNNNLTTLKSMLEKHIREMEKRVSKKDLNIFSDPDPTKLENDIYTKDYSKYYSFFGGELPNNELPLIPLHYGI